MIKFEDYIKNLNKKLHKYIPNPMTPAEEALYKPLDLFNVPKAKERSGGI